MMRAPLMTFLTALVLVMLAAGVAAQDATAPVITLHRGGIYAVSPDDGSAETLVEPPADYDEMRSLASDPITVFSAEWLSPDGRTLVYRTFTAESLASMRANNPRRAHEVHLLDLTTGETQLLPVAGGGRHVAITVDDVTWSPDGEHLYLTGSRSSDTASGYWLHIVERDAWSTGRTVPVPALNMTFSRRLLAANDGVVIIDRGVQSPQYHLKVYDNRGEHLHDFEIDWTLGDDINLYVNTPFNPLNVGGVPGFAVTRQISGEIAYIADFEQGRVLPYDWGSFPAMVSALAPDTSLRVSTSLLSDNYTGLLLRNADNAIVGDVSMVKTYAFGISGDSEGSMFSLSPDGQALAWLDAGALVIWREDGGETLPVTAEALVWSPPLYIPVEDRAFFAG